MALHRRFRRLDTPGIELEEELAMSFGVGLVIAMAVIAPPIMWVAWWLLADLGEKAGYPRAFSTPAFPLERRRAT